MQKMTYKTQRTYIVVPDRHTGKTRNSVNVAKLRKEISREWRGQGAVEEVRAGRGR